MKTRTNAVLMVMTLLVYFSGLRTASAFYDPGAQRWLNRDPLGELGFEMLRHRMSNAINVELNRYSFGGNDTISKIDPLGLYVFKFFNIGSHHNSNQTTKSKAVPLDNIWGIVNGNNAPPNMTITGPPSNGGGFTPSGPYTVTYNGGGIGDPIFFIAGQMIVAPIAVGVGYEGGTLAAEATPYAVSAYLENPVFYNALMGTLLAYLANVEGPMEMPENVSQLNAALIDAGLQLLEQADKMGDNPDTASENSLGTNKSPCD